MRLERFLQYMDSEQLNRSAPWYVFGYPQKTGNAAEVTYGMQTDSSEMCQDSFSSKYFETAAEDPNHSGFLRRSCQFYLGGHRSGSPSHYHGPAWNILGFGLKQWMLYPPRHAHTSRIPIVAWLRGAPLDNGQGFPLYCQQKAGDLLFVPEWWTHATFNIGDVIGQAVEMVETRSVATALPDFTGLRDFYRETPIRDLPDPVPPVPRRKRKTKKRHKS